MTRRRLLVGGTCAALALTAPLVVGASALGSAAPCKPGRTKLIAADSQSIVYLGAVVEPSGHARIATYLGCVRGNRRAYDLGGPGVSSSSGGGGTRLLTVAGSLAAWEDWEVSGVEGPGKRKEWTVVVRDLGTGRVLHRVPTGTAAVKGWTGVGPATEIVLSPSGSVAWIARVEDEDGQHGYEVHVVDKTGARLLAAGADIAPISLALAGHTLYWTQGGMPSATLLN